MKNGLLASLVLAAVISLVACASKVSAENYNKIENGMTKAQVHEILGDPDKVSGSSIGALSTSTEVWQGDTESISITFFQDKVRLKGMDAKTQN